jgi:hypothetical protein
MFKSTIILLLIALLSSCATVKKSELRVSSDSSHTSKLDSSWVTLKQISVPVPGAITPSLNLDSMRRAWLSTGGGKIPGQLRGQVFTQKDAAGRAELRWWFDSLGNINAECAARDQTIQALVEQNNRLIRETSDRAVSKETVKSKTVRRMPVWLIISLIGGGALGIAAIIWKFTRKVNPAVATADTLAGAIRNTTRNE